MRPPWEVRGGSHGLSDIWGFREKPLIGVWKSPQHCCREGKLARKKGTVSLKEPIRKEIDCPAKETEVSEWVEGGIADVAIKEAVRIWLGGKVKLRRKIPGGGRIFNRRKILFDGKNVGSEKEIRAETARGAREKRI